MAQCSHWANLFSGRLSLPSVAGVHLRDERASGHTAIMVSQRWDGLAEDISRDVEMVVSGDLSGAVSAHRRGLIELVLARTSDSPTAAAVVLADALWGVAKETSAVATLSDAMSVLEGLATRLPEGHRVRDEIVLPKLRGMLAIRARETGSLDDNLRLIDIARYLVAAPVAGLNHPQVDGASILIDALHRRFVSTGDPALFDESIEVAATWARDTGNGPAALTTLSSLFLLRFQAAADPGDLDGAIDAGRLALGRLRMNPRTRPDGLLQVMINLAQAFQQRFASGDDVADLDESLALYSELTSLLSADSPDYPVLLSNFGMALLAQFDRTGDSQLLDEAVRMGLRAMAASAEVDGSHRTTIKAALSKSLRRRYEEQRDPADLSELMRLDVTPGGRQAGNPGAGARRLAGRSTDQWMRLATQWDELVAEVRGLHGFEDFLMVPRFDGLRKAAEGGPIVMLNAGPQRCDAVVVHPERAEPVALEKLTIEMVESQVKRYLKTIWDYQQACRDEAMARARIDGGAVNYQAAQVYDRARAHAVGQQKHMDATFTEIAEWMWYALAEPVLSALGSSPGGDAPRRLWWCPTGLLAFLPVHAAGLHAHASGQTVLDTVISSYVPSLRALLQARVRPQDESGSGDLLLVAVPEAVGGGVPLLKVDEEVAMLRDLLGGRCSLRAGEAATRQSVLEDLRAHRHAHFSCHGLDDPADPRQAGVRMHDGLLSVRDIAAARFSGEFAFLSACKTATSISRLPDEALNLASALHHAGFRHVVATQWSVYDSVAAEVSRLFYAAATDSGRLVPDRAAVALHGAVKELRNLYPASPSKWIPYVHLGP